MPPFYLTTKPAALTFAELAAEALLHKIVQTVAKRNELHLVDDFVDESKLQQQFGLLHGNATLLHIEQGRIVELSYGAAMGTLHIIGIDLKHGLRVHPRCLGSTKILIGHL